MGAPLPWETGPPLSAAASEGWPFCPKGAELQPKGWPKRMEEKGGGGKRGLDAGKQEEKGAVGRGRVEL